MDNQRVGCAHGRGEGRDQRRHQELWSRGHRVSDLQHLAGQLPPVPVQPFQDGESPPLNRLQLFKVSACPLRRTR